MENLILTETEPEDDTCAEICNPRQQTAPAERNVVFTGI
jgi:hypothetical protein